MTPEPPRRLGRGLDALLARRDTPKDTTTPPPATSGSTAPNATTRAADTAERSTRRATR